MSLHALCVFAGSSDGARPAYRIAAAELGRALAEREVTLVYGGARSGLMGALADAALGAGGEVTGVIPRGLVDRERVHTGLTDLRVVETMHERKALMAELADGFVALPGGIGTLEELIEVLSWTRLGLHDKLCGLVDLEGYYEPLLRFLDVCVRERFLDGVDRERLLRTETIPDLLEALNL